MRYVVCYDVSNDRRRRKIAECLDGFGDRVQESVFELPVSRDLLEQCIADVMMLMNTDEDCIAIYRICAGCEDVRFYLGNVGSAASIGEETVFIV